jgi:hypothetical protein
VSAIIRGLVDQGDGGFDGPLAGAPRGELCTHGGCGQLLTVVTRSSATVEQRRGARVVRRVQAAQCVGAHCAT